MKIDLSTNIHLLILISIQFQITNSISTLQTLVHRKSCTAEINHTRQCTVFALKRSRKIVLVPPPIPPTPLENYSSGEWRLETRTHPIMRFHGGLTNVAIPDFKGGNDTAASIMRARGKRASFTAHGWIKRKRKREKRKEKGKKLAF